MSDKMTLQVLANHARAAAENMAHTLHRTAHSAFVKETQDFTVLLMDKIGDTFAVPMDLGATWYPGLSHGSAITMVDDYRPGDVAFTNDPYSGQVATHRTRTCGARSLTATTSWPLRAGISTTPTWAVRCLHRCPAR